MKGVLFFPACPHSLWQVHSFSDIRSDFFRIPAYPEDQKRLDFPLVNSYCLNTRLQGVSCSNKSHIHSISSIPLENPEQYTHVPNFHAKKNIQNSLCIQWIIPRILLSRVSFLGNSCDSFLLCLCLLLTTFQVNLHAPLCAVAGSWHHLCCEGSKLSALLLGPRLQTMGQLFGFPQCPEENPSGEHQLQDVVLSCQARGSSLCQWWPGDYMQSVQDIQKQQFQFGLQCYGV